MPNGDFLLNPDASNMTSGMASMPSVQPMTDQQSITDASQKLNEQILQTEKSGQDSTELKKSKAIIDNTIPNPSAIPNPWAQTQNMPATGAPVPVQGNTQLQSAPNPVVSGLETVGGWTKDMGTWGLKQLGGLLSELTGGTLEQTSNMIPIPIVKELGAEAHQEISAGAQALGADTQGIGGQTGNVLATPASWALSGEGIGKAVGAAGETLGATGLPAAAEAYISKLIPTYTKALPAIVQKAAPWLQNYSDLLPWLAKSATENVLGTTAAISQTDNRLPTPGEQATGYLVGAPLAYGMSKFLGEVLAPGLIKSALDMNGPNEGKMQQLATDIAGKFWGPVGKMKSDTDAVIRKAGAAIGPLLAPFDAGMSQKVIPPSELNSLLTGVDNIANSYPATERQKAMEDIAALKEKFLLAGNDQGGYNWQELQKERQVTGNSLFFKNKAALDPNNIRMVNGMPVQINATVQDQVNRQIWKNITDKFMNDLPPNVAQAWKSHNYAIELAKTVQSGLSKKTAGASLAHAFTNEVLPLTGSAMMGHFNPAGGLENWLPALLAPILGSTAGKTIGAGLAKGTSRALKTQAGQIPLKETLGQLGTIFGQ